MAVLGNDSFVRLRAPLVESARNGSQYRDWENAEQTTILKCNIQPFPMAEKLNFEVDTNREFSRTAYRFYCPPGTDIQPTDRVIYNGQTMSVFGHPGDWHRFSGQKHHVVFIARVEVG